LSVASARGSQRSLAGLGASRRRQLFRAKDNGCENAIAAADADAAAVFAADVAKARELRMSLARNSGQLDAERLDHYWASLGLLEHHLGHHPLVRQLHFELEALELLPPT
jgi:hypothetical protein